MIKALLLSISLTVFTLPQAQAKSDTSVYLTFGEFVAMASSPKAELRMAAQGYIIGVATMMHRVQDVTMDGKKFCFALPASAVVVAASMIKSHTFPKLLSSNPKIKSTPAQFAVLNILNQLFPCKGQKNADPVWVLNSLY